MAGKVAKFGLLAFGNGNSSSGSSEFRENHSSGSGNGKLPGRRRTGNIMEEYLSNFIDEDVVIGLLETDKKRGQALQHLDRQFHENNSLLIFQDKHSLFKGFSLALEDRDKNVRIQCTKLISKIIPQLGNDLDKCLHIVLPKIVANIGDASQSLQRESNQLLHVYMKNSSDVYQILRTIANSGMMHENMKTRNQIINTFPTLLFPEFKNEDFFDIVFALMSEAVQNTDKDKILKTLVFVKRFVGPTVFQNYVDKLPEPLQLQQRELQSYERRHSSSSTSIRSMDVEAVNGDISTNDYMTSSVSLPPSLSTSKISLDSNGSWQNFNNNNNENQPRDFDKTMYFDSNTVKNSLGKSRTYSNRSNKENYFVTSSVSEQPPSQHYEFGFISKNIIERFSNADSKVRLQALDDLKTTLHNLRDISPLLKSMVPLISLLQPLVDDSTLKVSCGALQAFEVIAIKAQSELRGFVKPFVNAVSRRFGTSNNKIRSESTKVLLYLMSVLDPGIVLETLWPKLQDQQWKVREETVNLITASLLKFTLERMNVNPKLLCRYITKMLLDAESGVRLATLECIATIAHNLPNTQILMSAVDNMELMHDDATGIMPAVQARVVRKQLPRLNEDMLVEYAHNKPTPLSSNNQADTRWINSASQPSSSGLSQSMKVRSSSTDMEAAKVRRYPRSAGKHRNNFPWTREDLSNEDHPSSAPVNKTQRSNLNDPNPPIRPRNTWGPETENPQRRIQRSNDVAYTTGPSGSNNAPTNAGNSYAEIYQKRKEANATKEIVSSGGRLSKHLSEDQSAFERPRGVPTGGYQPSFAMKDSANPSMQTPASASLSNSCPSAFFKENSQKMPTPRRNQEPVLDSNDSPIHLKPKLVRSAKRRSIPKIDDNDNNMLSVTSPIKFKNSASPRMDRIASNPARDNPRTFFKTRSSLADMLDDSTADTSIGNNYTPSGLQRNFTNDHAPKAVIRNPQQKLKSPLLAKTYTHETSNNNYTFSERRNESYNAFKYAADTSPPKNTDSSGSQRQHPSPLHKSMSLPFPKEQVDAHVDTSPPIQSSATPRTAPNAHKSPENNEYKSLELIRHSAQKKRDRIQRSISNSRETSARNSPSDLNGSYVGGHTSSNDSPILSQSRESFEASFYINGQPNRQNDGLRSPVSNNSTLPDSGYTSHMTKSRKSSSSSKLEAELSSPVMSKSSLAPPSSDNNEVPQVKFNPHSGISFGNDPKPVSVVGLGYGPKSPSGVNEMSLLSSPSLTPTNSSSNLSLTSPSKNARERRKNQRSSALGMASTTSVNHNDQEQEHFNVTGKAIRDASSTQFDNSDVLSSSSKDNSQLTSAESNSPLSKTIEGIYGRSVRQTEDENVPLSASLRMRSKKKRGELEMFRKSKNQTDSRNNDSAYSPVTTTKQTSSPPSVSKKAPQRSNDLSKPSSGLRNTTDVLPCEQPERAISEALHILQTTAAEQWESLNNAMHTIRRVATFHRDHLHSRMHEVMIALTQSVRNLRSQVSRMGVICLTDIYTHLRKPYIDTDLDVVVKALLVEHGKSNAFLRAEIDKTLQYVVAHCTSGKVLNAFSSFGVGHKSKDIRNTSAQFCFLLVEKMGPGKCLSGVKDMTDKLFAAMASFVSDREPDSRYYGRRMVNELMTHEDFIRCLDQYLPSKQAQEVKDCMQNIKQRGIGSISSATSRKNDSGLRRNGSTRVPTRNQSSAGSPDNRLPQISSGSTRKRSQKVSTMKDHEQEDLRTLCRGLSQGDMTERREAVNTLLMKIEGCKTFVEENIVKIVDAFVSLLTTSNVKLNTIGLKNLLLIVDPLKESLRECVQTLVPPICKLLGSKPHSVLALQVLDKFINAIDHIVLLPLIANSAMYAPGKTKQVAIEKLSELVLSVGPRKQQAVERHALPVLWSLFSQKQSANLRAEVRMLATCLYRVLGDNLLQYAESRNLSAQLQALLNSA